MPQLRGVGDTKRAWTGAGLGESWRRLSFFRHLFPFRRAWVVDLGLLIHFFLPRLPSRPLAHFVRRLTADSELARTGGIRLSN